MHNGFQWFQQFGISTNFIASNFQPLVLLAFLILKFCIVKLLIRLLPQNLMKWLDMPWEKFYHHFMLQLSCFMPFFIISICTDLLDLAQVSWLGLINSSIQIMSLFLAFMLPVVSLCLKLMQKGDTKSIMEVQTMRNIFTSQKGNKQSKFKKKVAKSID